MYQSDNTWVTLWLVTLVTLTNHNVTGIFFSLSLLHNFFVILYTCDIMVDQCHQPQCQSKCFPGKKKKN